MQIDVRLDEVVLHALEKDLRDEANAAISVLGACVLCFGWAIVTLIRTREFLRARGMDFGTPLFMGPLLLVRHLPQYREITRRETGRVGVLFYHWLLSINGAWMTALLALVLHQLSGR